jgi:hypothetical protein
MLKAGTTLKSLHYSADDAHSAEDSHYYYCMELSDSFGGTASSPEKCTNDAEVTESSEAEEARFLPSAEATLTGA